MAKDCYFVHYEDAILIGHPNADHLKNLLMKTTNVLLEKGLQVAAQKVQCQKPYMFLGHTRNNKTTKPQIPKSPNFIVYADLFGKPCLGMALPSCYHWPIVPSICPFSRHKET